MISRGPREERGGKSSPVAKTSRRRTFWRRVLSTVSLWALLLWGLFSGWRGVADWVLFGLVMALAAGGLREVFGLLHRQRIAHFPRLGSVLGLAGTGITFLVCAGILEIGLTPEVCQVGLACAFFVVLGLRRVFSGGNEPVVAALGATGFGIVYVSFLLNLILMIYFHPAVDGKWWLLFFIVVTKFSDAGAYVVGSLWGRHSMVPRISPGKTWEGFAGALVVATLLGMGVFALAGEALAPMRWSHALVLGLGLSGMAVVGDLLESLLKRQAEVKDSGRGFPGIGGVLDLADSLLFNAPLLYLYLTWLTRPE